MPKLNMTHTINCDVDAFWKLFFDGDFNKKIFLEDLHFKEYRVLELKEDDKSIRRRVECAPQINAPGAVKKLMGDAFKYVEDGTFDKATKVYRFKVIPSTMADKITNEGTIRAEPAGDGKTKRITEMTIEARVFGLGGMIESMTTKETSQGYDAYAQAANRHLAEKK